MQVTNVTFEAGQKLKLRIKPNIECPTFAFNIGHDGDNIALHFNPRFNSGGDVKTLIFNSCSGGTWGQEQRQSDFPFVCGKEFKIHIGFNKDMFDITLPNSSTLTFPNRIGDVKYSHFSVGGDAKLKGFRLYNA